MAKNPLYFIVWEEGKHYVSQCLNVDVSSFGETKDEALRNLNEAVDLYFEDQGDAESTAIHNPEIISASIKACRGGF